MSSRRKAAGADPEQGIYLAARLSVEIQANRSLGRKLAVLTCGLAVIGVGVFGLARGARRHVEMPKTASTQPIHDPILFDAEKEVVMTKFNDWGGQESLDLDPGTLFRQPNAR